MMWLLLPLSPIVVPNHEVAITQTIEVVYPVSGTVLSYEFEQELSPLVLVQGHSFSNGLRLYLSHVSLTNLTIPPLRVLLVQSNTTNTVVFDGWILRVTNTHTPPDKLHPLAPIYRFHDWTWLWIILSLGIIATAGWLFLKQRKKQQNEQTSITPTETIADHLERLRSAIDSLEEKTYYSEIAFLLRQILENVYGFPAREMGSREIASNIPAENELKESILDVLKWCDRVKYARHTTSNEKRHEIFASLEEIYHHLMPPSEETKTEETR